MRLAECDTCRHNYGGPNPDCGHCGGTGFTADGQWASGGAIEQLQTLINALIRDLMELRNEFEERRLVPDETYRAQFREEQTQALNEHYQALEESNRLLRDEVRLLAESMGLKPVRVSSDRYYTTKDKDPLLSNKDPSKVSDAVSIMVRQILKDSLSDEAIAEAGVRGYVNAAVRSNMEKVVKDAVGIDDWNRVSKNSPLRTRVEELLRPQLDSLRLEMIPEAINKLGLQDVLDKWMEAEARDLFVREIREGIRAGIVERAEQIAKAAVSELADNIILDEMPFLKKYLAMKRLGKDVGR